MSTRWPAAQDAVRADIVRVGTSLFQRGLVHSTAGNISVRLTAEQGGGFLITPTDACLGFLDAGQLAWVAEDGTALVGARASKTLALHRRIYAAASDAHCVLHTHSTHLVALTLHGVWRSDDILPPLTPYQVMKVGHVPLVPYRVPGDATVADDVAALMAASNTPLRAVMLERLGPTVWHDSPGSAMALLEELEETARLWLLTERRPTPLTDAQIDDLRARFNAPW
ncbi:class II aldolase/adducin family protein [Hydrogenophaga sp. PBL-H3]|uniref:class II aldolase/adducin family protein n=1 Tax=Hydrogenophaga sp. PBL-H3 TaxID=434010 RepID=UPI00132009FA|nr:aldolase [Hydrogenophaga sp. PBL-H3]QHE74591.1 aldolase [Hydrogenophaga sp. PBL-H3]QHE79016.1 aldolase [Hydrogenophaga sp. PBL-H3]